MVEVDPSHDGHSESVSPTHYDRKLVKEGAIAGSLDTPSLFRSLPPSFPEGVDPGLALSNYCLDLQSRVDVLRSVLNLPQTPAASSTQGTRHSVDLERFKEDLSAVRDLLSQVADAWTRRETGPVLPV